LGLLAQTGDLGTFDTEVFGYYAHDPGRRGPSAMRGRGESYGSVIRRRGEELSRRSLLPGTLARTQATSRKAPSSAQKIRRVEII
jgi:hypothetical protein